MIDLETFTIEPPPKQESRPQGPTEAAEWHALSWRPAGALPLAERWLRAGETRQPPAPPHLKRRK